MSYSIKRTNKRELVELKENEVLNGVISNLALIGKLTPDYGSYQSENFVHLAENFASEVFPETPILGQLFYYTQDNCLYVCVDEQFKKWTKLLSIRFEQQSNPQLGDIYYSTEDKKLYVYDNTVGDYGDYVLIGPENFKNKRTDATVLESNRDIKSAYYSFDIEEGTASLITIKVVACEKMDKATHPEYGIRTPECASWVYKLLAQSYTLENGLTKVEIIGDPNYELIGRTSGEALNWKVTPSVFDNRIQIAVEGIGTNNSLVTPDMDKVEWEIDIEIVKA